MTDNTETAKIKGTQIRNLAFLAGLVLIGFVILIYMISENSSKKLDINNEKANFADPLDHVDPESVVLEKTQKQLRDTEKKTESLQQQVNVLTDFQQSEKEILSGLSGEMKKRVDGLEKEIISA